MDHASLPRFVLALKGYFILRRSWRCAWAMAQRWPAAPAHRPTPLLAAPLPTGRLVVLQRLASTDSPRRRG